MSQAVQIRWLGIYEHGHILVLNITDAAEETAALTILAVPAVI